MVHSSNLDGAGSYPDVSHEPEGSRVAPCPSELGRTGVASLHTLSTREEVAREDRELLELAAQDPSALGPLYDRYARVVYGLALAMLGSRDEAEDLTQEIFVSVCGPTGFDPGRGSVGAFLITMTRSRAIDRLRRRVRSVRLLKSWHEGLPAVTATMPCEQVSMRRTAERVRAGLAGLPGLQRQILEMAYFRGLSQRQIAAVLDLPLGTVKSRSRRALVALGCTLDDLAG